MLLLFGWLSPARRERKAVRRILATLDKQKTPVPVDVEGTGTRFFTKISLHRSGLVLVLPSRLRVNIPKHSFVRLTLPNSGRKQVRVRVAVPLFKRPFSSRYACICELPNTFSGECQRSAERFGTARYKSLVLQIPKVSKKFGVLDLSDSGLRIVTSNNGATEPFELGAELGPASLRIGDKANIEFASLVPRSCSGKKVGFETRLKQDPSSERIFKILLSRLQQQELARLRADAL